MKVTMTEMRRLSVPDAGDVGAAVTIGRRQQEERRGMREQRETMQVLQCLRPTWEHRERLERRGRMQEERAEVS